MCLANVGTDPLNKARCCACGSAIPGSEFLSLTQRLRGTNRWERCCFCHAYFLSSPFDLQEEVRHTTQAAWGRDETGIALNSHKQGLYSAVMGRVLRASPPPGRLVDVGSSYGGFLQLARGAGYNVLGIEILPSAVNYCRSLGLHVENCESVAEVPELMHGATVDVFTCLDSNYYWHDQLSELQMMARALRPGGTLAVRTIDKAWLVTLGLKLRKFNHARGERLIKFALNDHRFSMPLASFLKLLASVGLTIVYASPRGALHGPGSPLLAKIGFAVGTPMWDWFRFPGAPGALVIALKLRADQDARFKE